MVQKIPMAESYAGAFAAAEAAAEPKVETLCTQAQRRTSDPRVIGDLSLALRTALAAEAVAKSQRSEYLGATHEMAPERILSARTAYKDSNPFTNRVENSICINGANWETMLDQTVASRLFWLTNLAGFRGGKGFVVAPENIGKWFFLSFFAGRMATEGKPENPSFLGMDAQITVVRMTPHPEVLDMFNLPQIGVMMEGEKISEIMHPDLQD